MAQFATCAVFASLIGMLYEGDGRPRIDQKGVENVNGYLFMLCTGTLFSSLFPPLQLFFRGLALARREAASGAYGLPLSVLAMQLADIVLQQALPCVFVSVTYRLIDPRHGLEQRLGAFLLVAQAVAFAGASLGYLIACLSPDSECRRPASFRLPDAILLDGVEALRHQRPFSPRSRDRCGAAVCLPDDPAGRPLRERGRDSRRRALDQQGVSPSSADCAGAFGSIYAYAIDATRSPHRSTRSTTAFRP